METSTLFPRCLEKHKFLLRSIEGVAFLTRDIGNYPCLTEASTADHYSTTHLQYSVVCTGLNPLSSTIYGNHPGAIACPLCLDRHWVTPLQGMESHRPTQLEHSHVTCSHWLVMQSVTSYIYHQGTGPGVLWYLVVLVSTPSCTGSMVHFR